jgi:1,4-alpha-glucan branching enzyme
MVTLKQIILSLSGLVLLLTCCTMASTPLTGPAIGPSGIRFCLLNKKAKTVSVAGTFNHWDITAHFLTKGPDDYWSIELPLPKGRYQYLFVIDQKIWLSDPRLETVIDDGFGRKNSLLVVE